MIGLRSRVDGVEIPLNVNRIERARQCGNICVDGGRHVNGQTADPQVFE
jgi:hypothetical protein